MDAHQHWEKIYSSKAPHQMSWFRPHLETSLALIERASQRDTSTSIIDVGGGASTLVDDLIARTYRNITVIDISQIALDAAQTRLGNAAESARWLRADVLQTSLPANAFDLWHDRAVFHFLTTPQQRQAYVGNLSSALKASGHVIVSTFGPEGPAKCSGLDVVRYDAEALHAEFGTRFRLVERSKECHETPFGTQQQFLYCCFR